MIETRKSFCRICHAACPVLIDVEVDVENGEKAVAVRGDRDDPLFEGYTCIKGRQLPAQHHHPDRIRSPLKRGSAGLQAVSSVEALDEIAEAIRRIVELNGPRAVASYTGTGAYQNSTSLAVATAFHRGFDSPSIYTSLTIDQPAHRAAALRMGSWEAGWHNFTDADVSLAVGYNPLVSSYGPAGGLQGTNPFVRLRQAKERGMNLIVIDPRRTELAAAADIWLQVQPGEDPTLLAALVRVILAKGLTDAEFCHGYVDGIDDLAAAVDPYTLDYAATRCRVPAKDIEAAAEMFAAGPRGAAGTGTGPNMAPHSMLSEHLTLTLNVLCGRVNRPGDRLESGAFLGPGDTRRAQVTPPGNPTPGASHRMYGLAGLPDEMLTNRLADEILTEGAGQVRALIVSGGNPVVAFPDQARTLAAMEALELLVVIDHRMTATAEFADYVIAPRLELERADVPHLMDRRFPTPYVNYTPAVLDSGDDLLAEWEVFAGISARNGWAIDLPGGAIPFVDEDVADGVDDDQVLDLVYGGARLSVDVMRSNRGVVLPDRAVSVIEPDVDADARFIVAPPDVLGELAQVLEEGSGQATLPGFEAGQYPYRLISRRLKHVLNSLGRELPALAAQSTTNYAYIHPADLEELGLVKGDLARITSPTGEVLGVVEPADGMKRGVVSMSHSWGGSSSTDEAVREQGAPTNRLISADGGIDPVTGMAVQSAIPVAIAPAAAGAPAPVATPS